MPNKFLVIWDKFVWSLDKTARICKGFNGKFLGILMPLVGCCTAVSFLGQDSLATIPLLKSAYYDTIVAKWPDFVIFLSAPVGKVAFGIIATLFIICYLFRKLYRPCALLIAHSTMGHNLSALDKSFSKAFWLKRKEICYQLSSQDASSEQIVEALRLQDKAFSEIKQKNWRSTIFYYGIAHTPLIFRLGYQFGQTASIRFLHRFRIYGAAQGFAELPEADKDKLARLYRRDNKDPDVQSKELLVAISTSYPIIEENLLAIDPNQNMYRYWVQVDEADNGVDFFNSYHKIHSYADSFKDDIEKIVRRWNIQTVHIVISSSVPFTFYLGQLMNNNQFRKIIVYHYDHTRFTWGIDMMERDPQKAIVWATALAEGKKV
jgi:hypothetical protein